MKETYKNLLYAIISLAIGLIIYNLVLRTTSIIEARIYTVLQIIAFFMSIFFFFTFIHNLFQKDLREKILKQVEKDEKNSESREK